MFEGDGDGGFAAGGEAGQPDGEAVLAAEGGALAGGDVRGVEGDVAVEELVGGVTLGDLWFDLRRHGDFLGW